MTSVLSPLGVKRSVAAWMIAVLLWIFRAAFRWWFWLAVISIPYGMLGLLAFGRVIPAGIAALGSAGSVWVHIHLHRELTAASEKEQYL
jgi:hypothetical protein